MDDLQPSEQAKIAANVYVAMVNDERDLPIITKRGNSTVRYFTNKGRLRPALYWLYNVGLVVLVAGAAALETNKGNPLAGLAYLFVFLPVLIWMASNLMTARLHDADLSGWWQWVVWGPLAVAMASGWALPFSHNDAIKACLLLIVSIGNLLSTITGLWLWLARSTKGANRFGPDWRDEQREWQFQSRVEK